MLRDDGKLDIVYRIADSSSAIKAGGGLDDTVKVTIEISGLQADPATFGALMLFREQLIHGVWEIVEHGKPLAVE